MYVLLSERLLGARQKRPHGRRIQIERGSQFAVTEAIAAQNEQLGGSGIERGQGQAHLLAGFVLSPKLFRVRRKTKPICGVLGSSSPGIPAKLVERQPDRGAVNPATGLLALHLRVAPQLPERLDRNFFGTRRIANHARHYADSPFIAFVEEGFKSLVASGHYSYNDARRGFVTAIFSWE